MSLRLCKLVVVANSFAFLLLVVFNNLTDYGSNYQFIQHVLSMDMTFPGNSGMWRAIHSPAIYKLFYASIIFWEAACCFLLACGMGRMWVHRSSPPALWKRAKLCAVIGLTASLTQWYFAFVTVGGEWFLMWQSKVWNGQEAAFRMFTMMGLSLVFLCLGGDDLD